MVAPAPKATANLGVLRVLIPFGLVRLREILTAIAFALKLAPVQGAICGTAELTDADRGKKYWTTN